MSLEKTNKETTEDQRGVLSKFLDGIHPDDRHTFLKSLSEREKILFSSSEEEFRQVFERDSHEPFPKEKGEFERDVSFSGIREDRIKERFDEVMKLFPQNRSVDGLRKLANKEDHDSLLRSNDDLKNIVQPSLSVSITLNQIKEKVANGS